MNGALSTLRTCAFCGESDWTDALVHYSVRRYAHGACLFRAKGEAALAGLFSHQISALPVLPLLDAGLAPAETILAKLDMMHRAAKAREDGLYGPRA